MIWIKTKRSDPALARLAARHYSSHHNRFAKTGKRKFDLPGHTLHLYIPSPQWPFEIHAGWVWWYPPNQTCLPNGHYRMDGYDGYFNCAIFRNEAPYLYLSSELIREAVDISIQEWGYPEKGWDTYVWPSRVRSTNPGYCYLKAGWQRGNWSADGKKLRLFYLVSERRP